MKVAVTGAAGYIGGWLTAALAARGHLTALTDRHPVPRTASAVFDLADDARRRAWLDETRPDVVVHLAALYGRVWGEQDLRATTEQNTGITAALARDCAARGIRVMFASSSEVYGLAAAAGTCYETEAQPLRPVNMYGMSKKWAEEACRAYCPDGLMIARLNMPSGPGKDTPAVGERPRTSGVPGTTGYNALHSYLWQARHGLPLRAHAGTARCYTWAGDTITGMIAILESGQRGIWNVGRNDEHVTAETLARKVIALTGSSSELTVTPPPGGVTPHKCLDNARLLRLGWTPKVPLDGIVKLSADYYGRFDAEGRWAG